MKKIILICLALLMLVGCSKIITCSVCGQENKGKTYTLSMLGASYEEDICNDCIKDFKAYFEALGGSIK